jgi:hypothetical protein
MEETSNIKVSNLGLTNIFEIKDSINKRFESRGLPHRLYTEVFESVYDEYTETYLPPHVKIYINLKINGYSYYRLETFKLTSNMCQLYNESDVMKMVMKKLKLNVNPIKKTVKKVEEVHQNILQKTLKIFSSVNPFYYISTVIKS